MEPLKSSSKNLSKNTHKSAPKNTDADVSGLILALGLLIRRLRSEASAETHDLSWTQKAVIVRLETEGPATIAELARAENVKPQSMGTGSQASQF